MVCRPPGDAGRAPGGVRSIPRARGRPGECLARARARPRPAADAPLARSKPRAPRRRTSPMLLFDPLYLLIVGPTLLLAVWASWRVQSTFARFSNVGVRSGMTGAEAAAAVARAGGSDVTIERHQGFLSDHY